TTGEQDTHGASVNHTVFHDVQRPARGEYPDLVSVQANIIYNILRAVSEKLNTSETESIDVAVLNCYTVPAGHQDADSGIGAARSMERGAVKIKDHLIRVDSDSSASSSPIGEATNQKISARNGNEKRYRAYWSPSDAASSLPGIDAGEWEQA